MTENVFIKYFFITTSRHGFLGLREVKTLGKEGIFCKKEQWMFFKWICMYNFIKRFQKKGQKNRNLYELFEFLCMKSMSNFKILVAKFHMSFLKITYKFIVEVEGLV